MAPQFGEPRVPMRMRMFTTDLLKAVARPAFSLLTHVTNHK